MNDSRLTVTAINPHETRYQGHRFRSRFLARWAVFFDEMGIRWEYEPPGFALTNGVCYRPDFYLPELHVWVEIKPNHDIPYSDRQKIARFAYEKNEPCLLIVGIPGKQIMYLLDRRIADQQFVLDTEAYGTVAERRGSDQKHEFFSFLEDFSLVRFGVIPLSNFELGIVFECQPINIDEKNLRASNKARNARFEFGEPGGAA